MPTAPKPENLPPPVRGTTSADEQIDTLAVIEFTRRLQRAAMVRKRGAHCAAVATCDGCPLVCALWFPAN